jgi:hypothetical protein
MPDKVYNFYIHAALGNGVAFYVESIDGITSDKKSCIRPAREIDQVIQEAVNRAQKDNCQISICLAKGDVIEPIITYGLLGDEYGTEWFLRYLKGKKNDNAS